MVYNPNIPQPNDNIGSSQADILANFQALGAAFNSFNQITFQNASAPAPPADPTSILHTLNPVDAASVFFSGKPLPFFLNSVGDFPVLPNLKKTQVGAEERYSFKIGPMLINFNKTPNTGAGTFVLTYQTPFTSAATVLYRGYAIDSNGTNLSFVNIAQSDQTKITLGNVGGPGGFVHQLSIGY